MPSSKAEYEKNKGRVGSDRRRRQPTVRSDTFIGDFVNLLTFRPIYRTPKKDKDD